MERLTIEKGGSILLKDLSGGYVSPCFGCESIGNCVSKKIQPCVIYRALEKLKEYEDLEEQKRLLKFPCAPGDTVYWIDEELKTPIPITVTEVASVTLGKTGNGILIEIACCDNHNITHYMSSDFNKAVFFKKEAAERALKKLNETEETGC